MGNTTFRRIAAAPLFALALAAAGSSAGATTLERIKATGVTTVCADPANLPLSHSGMNPPGYDLEIAGEFAKSLGAKLQYHWFATLHTPRVLRQLYEEKCDFVVGIPVDKRLEGASPRMALTQPYLTTGFGVVVGPNVQAQSLNELKGKRIGVEMHSAADFLLFDLGHQRDLYDSQATLFKALADGEVEAGVMWAPAAGWLTSQQSSAKLRILQETRPELTFPLAVAVRKDDSDLLKALNQATDELIRSGKRDEIVGRYGFPKFLAGASTPDLKSLLSFSPPPRKSFMVAVGGKRETVIDAPQVSEEAVHQGNVMYHRTCGKCHGRNGISGGIAPDLRRFQGNDQEFMTTVQTGRPGTMMPAWKEVLSEDELTQIRAYVKSLGAIE